MKPKDVGYPHELWTHKLLSEHIQKNCVAMGFPEASKISSGTISKILGASNIKPHKIASYIHQVDPDFDSKSVIVLHTYKKVELLKKLKSEGGDFDQDFNLFLLQNMLPGLILLRVFSAK